MPFHDLYSISGSTLVPLDKSVNEVGFVFDPKLSPNLHIERVCCKALKTPGFVKRVAVEFKLISPLKALFCLLVRPYFRMLFNHARKCSAQIFELRGEHYKNWVFQPLLCTSPKITQSRHLSKPLASSKSYFFGQVITGKNWFTVLIITSLF